jgi:hypothetical protein
VIQDDIKNYVKALTVCGVNKGAKLSVGVVGIAGEAGIDVEKIVNAVAVIGAALKRNVLENRTDPDGARSQLFDVGS